MKTLVCVASTALALAGHAFTYSARSYVQRGLIGHFDGLENAGYGQHDATVKVWKNLVSTNLVDDLPCTPLPS